MCALIPGHGNPEAQKFGIVGESSNTDGGSIYAKKSDDRLNVGWENLLPTFTPTPTPTPTMTVTPTRTTTMPVTPSHAAVTPSPTISQTTVFLPSQTPTPTVTPTLTPTISVTPASTGNVNPRLGVNGGQAGIAGTIGSGFYPPGTVIYVEAILAPGFVFDSWSDEGTGHLQTGSYPNWPNPNSILMPAFDIVITPIGTTNFTLTTSTTVLSLGPLGQSPGGTGPTGGGAHSNGEVVNVSITPDANTSGVLVIDGNPRPAVAGTNSDSVNITMTGNKTAQAQWSWKNVNWRTSISGGGSANPVGPGNTTTGTVKKSQTINIIANVFSGTFGNWSCTEGGVVFGNASLPNTSATINSDGEHTLVANLSTQVVFVNGQYSQYGSLEFDFSYPGGSSTYTSYGSAGSYVYNINCASSIGTIYQGNAWLTGTAC